MKTLRKWGILSLGLGLSICLWASPTNSRPDLEGLLERAKIAEHSNPDSALVYYQELERLATREDAPHYLRQALEYLSFVNLMNGRSQEAMVLYERLIPLVEDTIALVEHYSAYASIVQNYDPVKANSIYQKATKIIQEKGIQKDLAGFFSNYAFFFNVTGGLFSIY